MASNAQEKEIDWQIRTYLRELSVPVQSGPRPYIIGDGASWYEQVGSEFDKARSRSAKLELRKAMTHKLTRYKVRAGTEARAALIDDLEIAIRNSDEALIEAAKLVGIDASDELFAEIEKIVNLYTRPSST